MKTEKTKLLIIGAGPAGLSAARFAQEAGITDVIVLERAAQVGGKCCTLKIDDRHYEYGAVFATPAYKNVLSMMQATRLKRRSWFEASQLVEKSQKWVTLPSIFQLNTLRQSIMFKFHFRGNSGESTPGFGGRLAKLSQSLEEAVAAKGVADTARDLAMFTTGFGYGYHNEIATAYYMKYMSVISVPAYEFAEFGYGTLCTRVAETLDVRLNQVVAKVTRAPDGVTIETSDTRFEAEYLLIASPLDEALGYLDATPREIELYERIRYYNYQVVGAEVTGLSHLKRFSFFQSRVTPSSAGRPVFICKRWPDRDIVLFYVLGESSVGGTVKLESQAVDNCILEDIKALGGTLVKFHERRSWKYFPHVTPAEFASGFHERLETLQGQNRTFLTGELLNFSSVETVMNYSRHVIENLVLPGLSFRKVG